MFSPRLLLSAALVLVAASQCFAKPPFWKVFVDTYHINPNSAIGKARCLTCHAPPPRRNAYGLEVQAALEAAHARMVTPEILRSIEKKDADGDGFTNIAEIKADSMPGDAKSKPAVAKPVKKHPLARHKKHKRARRHRNKLSISEPAAIPFVLIALSVGAMGCSSLRRKG